MTRKIVITALLSILFTIPILAQEGGIDVGYVSIINLGDGRLLHREILSDTPLQGEQRIIDGVKSEYKSVHFTDGLFDGEYSYYRNNKLVEKGYYKDGRKDGIFKEYYSDGETVKRSRGYSNGKLEGADITYYTNGSPEREKWYKESKEHGRERRWDYESGTLLSDKNYVNDKLHGEQMEYIRSNVSDYVVTSNYDMGVLEGEYSEVFTDGVIRKEGRYERGRKVGEWYENERKLTDKGQVRTIRKR